MEDRNAAQTGNDEETGEGHERSAEGEAKQGDTEKPERTTAEWVTLVVSVAIVLALAGLVVFQYVAQGTAPPAIKVEAMQDNVRQVGEAYYLPVTVTNEGDIAVEDVMVELTLETDGMEPEVVSFSLPFLAGHETDEQIVVFNQEPESEKLTYTLSFHEP